MKLGGDTWEGRKEGRTGGHVVKTGFMQEGLDGAESMRIPIILNRKTKLTAAKTTAGGGGPPVGGRGFHGG